MAALILQCKTFQRGGEGREERRDPLAGDFHGHEKGTEKILMVTGI